ncbi:MAG TPA: hydrogenase maturation nickel metallochaperone HypA [Gammaproteobacteria bacterium]|nr:hydrogenase maturation nickel metallochaperone HypA [Gammaproteobacteria bacterium]
MHELALARSLIEMVDEYAFKNGGRPVRRINCRLGELSAMTRALYFCFESASKGSRCEGAELVIEEVPLSVFCHTCNAVKTPSGRFNFRCPDCGFPTPKVVTGREMQLTSIELEAADENAARTHLSADYPTQQTSCQ